MPQRANLAVADDGRGQIEASDLPPLVPDADVSRGQFQGVNLPLFPRKKGAASTTEITPCEFSSPSASTPISLQVKEIIGTMLARASAEDRAKIAEVLAGMTGQPWSATKLNKLVAPSADKRLAVDDLPALSLATGSSALVEFIAAQTGLEAVDPATARWGRFARNVARELKELWGEVA